MHLTGFPIGERAADYRVCTVDLRRYPIVWLTIYLLLSSAALLILWLRRHIGRWSLRHQCLGGLRSTKSLKNTKLLLITDMHELVALFMSILHPEDIAFHFVLANPAIVLLLSQNLPLA